jgi:hypothetical protein
MVYQNVTLGTAPSFPILYTWGGQEYEIASLSGLGCVDTVYSTTATTTNGTTTYSPYVVLPANQGLQVIEAYEAQFGVPSMACSSYIQQADLLNGVNTQTSSGTSIFGFDVTTAGGFFDFAVFVIVILGIVAVGIWMISKIGESMHGRR